MKIAMFQKSLLFDLESKTGFGLQAVRSGKSSIFIRGLIMNNRFPSFPRVSVGMPGGHVDVLRETAMRARPRMAFPRWRVGTRDDGTRGTRGNVALSGQSDVWTPGFSRAKNIPVAPPNSHSLCHTPGDTPEKYSHSTIDKSLYLSPYPWIK
jgi:hypothetical protein